jgi:hypothetical protein
MDTHSIRSAQFFNTHHFLSDISLSHKRSFCLPSGSFRRPFPLGDMQSNQPYENHTIVEVLSPDPINDPPKQYTSETSYSEGKTPAITDLPNPYNLHGDEKKRQKSASLRPNPHRKYSKRWFGHAYDAAVEIGKWPRIAYAAVGLILIIVWIAIM